MDNFIPMDANKLTKLDRTEALSSLMMFIEIRYKKSRADHMLMVENKESTKTKSMQPYI